MFIIPSQKIEITEDVEDDNITQPSFMIIPLELILVQIVDRHGSNSYIASYTFISFSFIVSYGYFFAGYVIIDNCSFANVEVFIGILGSLAFASVFIDILARKEEYLLHPVHNHVSVQLFSKKKLSI